MFKDDFLGKKAIDYSPSQPGFKINKDYYIQSKWLRDSINQKNILFYQFKTTNKKFSTLAGSHGSKDMIFCCDPSKKDENLDSSTLAVPDGCIDIIFCCDPQKPFANCYGTVLESKQVFFQANCEYFGVRYLPEQGICLMKELVDKEIPLLDIISTDSFIIEKIVNAKSFEERIELFGDFSNRYLFKLINVSNLVRYSLEKIYFSKGNIQIDQITQKTGYSIQYLRKEFEKYIGISPKLFSEIVRFQYSLEMVSKMPEYSLLDVVSENGYYDQAHFIKQFKKFSSLTPIKFKDIISNPNQRDC